MKTRISLPLTAVPLFIPHNRPVRSASDIRPFDAGGSRVTTDENLPDERLGGDTTVILFEHESEVDAFASGIDFVNPGDDWSRKTYILNAPIEGCLFALVVHNCDAPDELWVSKYDEEPEGTAR